MRWVLIGASIMALLFFACRGQQAKDSNTLESSAGAFKSQIAAFNKIIGRSPSADELKPMKSLTYEQQVDSILNSEVYKTEGFFNLHNNRLLLNRQGDADWIQGSDYDFCALRWEFEEAAKQDLSGDGYWSLLTHRTRWHAIGMSAFRFDSCYDVTVQKLIDLGKQNSNSFDGVDDSVRSCIAAVTMSTPKTGIFEDIFKKDGSMTLDYGKFVEYLSKFDASEMQSSLPDSKFQKDYREEKILHLDPSDIVRVPGTQLKKTGKDIPIRSLIDPSECSFSEGIFDQSIQSSYLPFYIQIELPAKAAGIHSSPYYLNRHPTSSSNQNLHRGRMLLYSYFCTDISPDAANVTGGPALRIPEHDEYFDPLDTHAQKSANCYNCHTKVQPMGNFFGAMDDGVPYEKYFRTSAIGTYRSLLKGGYNDGIGFFPIQGQSTGMDGLANLLSQNPRVKSCLVDTAWASLVGRNYPLSVAEKHAAIEAFSSSPVRYSQLLKHLMVNNERGRLYFERGEPTMARVKVDEEVDCEVVLNHVDEEAARLKVAGTCSSSCHARPFSDKAGNISPELYYSDNNVSKAKAASLWKKIYCQVKTGRMPPSSLDQEERNKMSCIIERKVRTLTSAGSLPADPGAFECESGIPSLKPTVPHN